MPPQEQVRLDGQLFTHLCQPAVAHQLGPQVGAGTHSKIGVVAVDEFGGGEPQHRIAEEFQSFQVPGATGRHVGERLIHLGQQLRINRDFSVKALDQGR